MQRNVDAVNAVDAVGVYKGARQPTWVRPIAYGRKVRSY